MTIAIQEPLGFVQIGAGGQGRLRAEMFVEEGWRPMAVVDPKLELAEALARDLGVPAFASMDEVSDDLRVNAGVVCTPHHTHGPVAKAAMRRGWNVLVEKPQGVNAAEVADMQAVAREHGVALAIGYQYVTGLGAVLDWAENNLVGIQLIEGYWNRGVGGLDGIPGSPPFWDTERAGIAPDLMSHQTSFGLKVGKSKPVKALGSGWNDLGRLKNGAGAVAADSAIVAIRLANQAMFVLKACWAGHFKQDEVGFTVTAVNGRLEIPWMTWGGDPTDYAPRFKGWNWETGEWFDGRLDCLPLTTNASYIEEAKALRRRILGQGELAVGPELALEIQEAIDMITDETIAAGAPADPEGDVAS